MTRPTCSTTGDKPPVCSFCYDKGYRVVDSDGTEIICVRCDAWKKGTRR